MNSSLKLILCIVCLGIVFGSTAQTIRVAGKITASNGTRIAGVHIFDSIAKNEVIIDKTTKTIS